MGRSSIREMSVILSEDSHQQDLPNAIKKIVALGQWSLIKNGRGQQQEEMHPVRIGSIFLAFGSGGACLLCLYFYSAILILLRSIILKRKIYFHQSYDNSTTMIM
mmetsp:Transcript_13909/g.15970  ORF Transcript_13909/g.15970 Transcript_13909/m.15970 type:complete len:105 (+) Transcript_13909:112-426(+)